MNEHLDLVSLRCGLSTMRIADMVILDGNQFPGDLLMHEMGIAASVIDVVRREIPKHPGAHVRKVGLRLGEWAGVDVESLRFCLEVLIKSTDLEPLDVDIDFRPRASDLDIAYLELEESDGTGIHSGARPE